MQDDIAAKITQQVEPILKELEVLRDQIKSIEEKLKLADEDSRRKPWKQNLFVPKISMHPKLPGPFMPYSTCSTADFLNPEFERLCELLGLNADYHRKFWEWVFILHHGLKSGSIAPGKRALGFAVGSEPLPAAFAAAGARVTATDAPPEIGIGQGWAQGGEYASQLSNLHNPKLLDEATFLSRVELSYCDMNAVPGQLNNYDFCWSACSFEHLGSISKGLDFVQESVEKCLKIGGVAVHTTEFNLSSNEDTVEEGATVLYRKRDLLAFIEKMEARGHKVEPLKLAPDAHVLDFYFDTPPYSMPPHLKLQLMNYVSTSVGLVITRGI